MKKLLVAGASTLGLIALVYGLWLGTPVLTSASEVETTRAAAQRRWEQARSVARDPSQNSYLAPSLRSFWGRPGEDADPQAKGAQALAAWLRYAHPDMPPPAYRKLEKDEKFQKALAGIATLEPELLEALRRPFFLYPEAGQWRHGVPAADLAASREVAAAVVALARVRLAQGKARDAVDLLGGVVRFGRSLSGYESLRQETVSMQIQQLAGQGYLELFGSGSRLEADEWKELATSFTASIPLRNQLAVSLESELTRGLNTLDALDQGEKIAPFAAWTFSLPGYPAREKKVYANAMMELLEPARQGKGLILPEHLAHPSIVDYLAGRAGQSTDVMLPAGGTLKAAFDHNRREMICLALVSATRAFAAQTGRLPENLDQIRAVGIAVPQPADLGPDGATWSRQSESVRIEAADTPHSSSAQPPRATSGGKFEENQIGRQVYTVHRPALSKW